VTALAELEGHDFDLAALARHFPTGDPRIVVNNDRTYLEASALDDVLNDAGGLIATAGEILRRLNGYAVLDDPSYRPVRLSNRFLPGSDATTVHRVVGDEARAQEHVVVVAVSAEIRLGALVAGTAVNSVPLAPSTPDGPRLLALGNSDFDDLLSIAGESGHLSWSDMYKAFEIIRDAVPGRGRDGLIATGWTTKADLSAFTGSADHHRVAGIHEARHARMSGDLPKRTMSREEAQVYIRDLARKWRDSLG
jgi:hypothetical protein